MNVTPRWLRAVAVLPHVCLAGAFVAGGGPWWWALVMWLVLLASQVVPPRPKLTTFAELVLTLGATAPPLLWAQNSEDDVATPSAMALMFLLPGAVRTLLGEPLWGVSATRVLGLGGAIAIGHGLKSASYPFWIAAYVMLALMLPRAQRDAGAARMGSARRGKRRWVAYAAMLAMALGALGSLAWALPKVGRMTSGRFYRWLQARQESGFTPFVRLDGDTDIQENESVVLRIHGPGASRVDYLRGAVLDSFDGTSWTVHPSRVKDPIMVLGALGDTGGSGGGAAGSGAGGSGGSAAGLLVEAAWRGPWTFAPEGFEVQNHPDHLPDRRGGRIQIDVFGTYRANGLGTEGWRLVPAADEAARKRAAEHNIAVTREIDLALPGPIALELQRVALAWTEGADTDAARIAALKDHLMGFRYTLSRRAGAGGARAGRRSAVLEFLEVSKEGHCEYFASALTLLARSLGIPARLVSGYRVVEHNTYGQYAVVRASNAHAWSEVWVDGAWRTVDATPYAPGLARRDASGAAALFDYLRGRIRAGYNYTVKNPQQSLPAFGVIIAAALAVRALRMRRARKGAAHAAATEATPVYYAAFEAALAKRGFERGPSETLGRFAARLRAAKRTEAAAVVEAYEAARYGGDAGTDAGDARGGDSGGLPARLRAVVAAWGEAPSANSP